MCLYGFSLENNSQILQSGGQKTAASCSSQDSGTEFRVTEDWTWRKENQEEELQKAEAPNLFIQCPQIFIDFSKLWEQRDSKRLGKNNFPSLKELSSSFHSSSLQGKQYLEFGVLSCQGSLVNTTGIPLKFQKDSDQPKEFSLSRPKSKERIYSKA